MGTSSSNRGPGSETPLVPTWSEEPPTDQVPPDQSATADDGQPTAEESETQAEPVVNRPPIEPSPVENRFRLPRTNFTRYVSSGGSNRRALGRALSEHVRTGSGGARRAARRMAASSRTAAKLTGLLRTIAREGIAETLRSLSLQQLSGRSPKEILAAFTDVICSSRSVINEAIAREAYVATVLELAEADIDLANLTEGQIATITVDFISHSIVLRILNDAGQKLDVAAMRPENVERLTNELVDFVKGIVKDRLAPEIEKTKTLSQAKLEKEMTRIYEIAWGLVEHEAENLI